jgi:hypothetical protein
LAKIKSDSFFSLREGDVENKFEFFSELAIFICIEESEILPYQVSHEIHKHKAAGAG